MARARNIKPGFYKNETLAECSIWARFIFPGLWMLADREGRLEDRPKRIKGELLPFDTVDAEPLLHELEQFGFIVRYQNADGRFIQIAKFAAHQSPHYSEKVSTIKPCDCLECDAHDEGLIPGALPENSGSPLGIDQSLRGGRNNLNPDSLNPDSLNPDSLNPDCPENAPASAFAPASALPDTGAAFALPAAVLPKPAKPPKPEKPPAKSAAAWDAYSGAYRERYGIEPIPNAKARSLLCQVVDMLGATEAPAVAAFYVWHNGAWYVRKMHQLNSLVEDAAKLRTEWMTGRTMTDGAARAVDRRQTAYNVYAPLIAEAEERERKEGGHGH